MRMYPPWNCRFVGAPARDFALYDYMFFVQASPIGIYEGGLALGAVVRLVRAMRNDGRRMNFIGLTSTYLSNEAALSLVAALDSLPPRKLHLDPEKLEILQVYFSDSARGALEAAAKRSGVDVLLSKANGPALRIAPRACF